MWQRRIALAVSVLLNVGFMIELHQLMQSAPAPRPLPARGLHATDVLRVRLIAAMDAQATIRDNSAVGAPAEQVPPRRPEHDREAHVAALPSARTPAAAAWPELRSADAQPLDLYRPDGSVRLPDSAFVPAPARDTFARRQILPYAPTRFERYWVPRDENLLGEWVRKGTVTRKWRTPWGTQIECVWVFALGGCGWGFVPGMTEEEMRAMHADPPMPKRPAAESGQAPLVPDS